MPEIKFENPLGELRMLKGAPLSVLWAIILAGQPVSSEWLSAMTGYDDGAVTKSTRFLMELHYIELRKSQNLRKPGWTIAGGAQQLPLMHNLSTGLSTDENEYPEKTDFPSTTTINTINLDKSNNDRLVVVDEYPEKTDFPPEDRKIALQIAGIYEPKASELARLDWATPEYILAQYMRYRTAAKKSDKYTTGLLIYWIAKHDPQPANVRFVYDDGDETLQNLASIRVRDGGAENEYLLDLEKMTIKNRWDM